MTNPPGTAPLTTPHGRELCPQCVEPVALHNGIKAIDCLVQLAHAEEAKDWPGINYLGPDPSVQCAWPPCTNLLRRSGGGGPQWCSEEHRERGDGG